MRPFSRPTARQLTILAMLAAIAYVVVSVARVPVVLFLKYEPKDVIITIGGFLFGPTAAFAVSAVVSFVEMVTISADGPIGCVMNILASCAFACTAAAIYKKNRSLKGAVIGLGVGALSMTAVMLLWNFFLTPIYMGVERSIVAGMLIPTFLPFNLLKGSLNAAITMLIYKPVTMALRGARLMPPAESGTGKGKAGLNASVILLSVFVIVCCVMLILVFQNKI